MHSERVRLPRGSQQSLAEQGPPDYILAEQLPEEPLLYLSVCLFFRDRVSLYSFVPVLELTL